MSSDPKPESAKLTEELSLDLAEFARQYERSADDDGRRAAAHQQIMFITLYLQYIGVPGETLRPAMAIADALNDITRGPKPSILKLNRKSEGKRIPSAHLKQRGLAAAAVTELIEADMQAGGDEQKLERALRKVAPRIRHWPAMKNRITKGHDTISLVETLRDWRNSAMTEPAGEADRATYKMVRAERFQTEHSSASWAEFLLTKGLKPFL